jgi:hypothetical protein
LIQVSTNGTTSLLRMSPLPLAGEVGLSGPGEGFGFERIRRSIEFRRESPFACDCD